MLNLIFPNLSRGAFSVLLRHRDVFIKMWKTTLIPPFLDPLFYLVGMGYGLGALVSDIDGYSYVQYIAPALVSSVIMTAPFFEGAIGGYVRMHYQKTWDAMIATPLSIEDVITGEILYGACRALLQAVSIMIVIFLFGLVKSPLALLMPFVCLIGGFMFGSIAIAYISWIPAINYIDFLFTLIMTPMFIFAGTFFPVSQLPPWAQKVAFFMPLYHVVLITRSLITGVIHPDIWKSVIWVIIVGSIAFAVALRLLRRRVVQ
ncbi:MAG: ABC transporter permease [candidate division Zixibacteria bacterium CG_4_9_14_3_um_filter_46_8]|nr:MAG: ABC transporter permease [candidate division Zixibacteria bacterium CG_4_9_14_3_um_filter_46_8]